MALYHVVFFQVTMTLKLSNMMSFTRKLGTARKEGLLTYWSQEMKGRLPIPRIKIFMVIIQHQEMRIQLEGIQLPHTTVEWKCEIVRSSLLVLETTNHVYCWGTGPLKTERTLVKSEEHVTQCSARST